MAALRTLAFLSIIAVSSSQTSECSYFSLIDHLNLTASNEALQIARPVKSWNTTTVVHLDMVLYGILGVHEKSQTVSLHVLIRMSWKNEFLSWNSTEFCGIDVMNIPRSIVWIPDIAIQEDASDTGSVQEDPFLRLDPSGLLSVTSRQQLTYTCQLDLFKFPFDQQNCSLEFSSLSYNRKSVQLETSGNGTMFTALSKKLKMTEGEWTLMELQVTEDAASTPPWMKSRLQYTVLLKRRPFLYVINLILPLLFLLFLDLASFFISESRGEKLSFKVTVLLSIFVLLLNLQTILPSTEEAMPMLAIYCVSIFTLVFLGVLEAVLVSFLIEMDESRREEERAESPPKRPSEEQAEEDRTEENQPDDQNLLNLILDKVLLTLQEVQHERQEKRKSGCFRKLAKLIDVVFFTIYLTTIVVSLIVLFLIWMQN
ncbi:5-hydroxytryptamine receptor 3A [Oryzias melastigma]|uniref:5-hydroxytryptamine receptor 3A-like n=1 Tax=Oryzias melastigma TaxID=30732 RepID=A0A3B3C6U2_ORYME|nr:5-hydroxytryptamine receptor 3A [Oryzias melastigma]